MAVRPEQAEAEVVAFVSGARHSTRHDLAVSPAIRGDELIVGDRDDTADEEPTATFGLGETGVEESSVLVVVRLEELLVQCVVVVLKNRSRPTAHRGLLSHASTATKRE